MTEKTDLRPGQFDANGKRIPDALTVWDFEERMNRARLALVEANEMVSIYGLNVISDSARSLLTRVAADAPLILAEVERLEREGKR